MSKHCIQKQLSNNHVKSAIGEYKKFWETGQVINIAFMPNVSEVQKRFIQLHSDAWLAHANLFFNWHSSIEDSDVRIDTVSGAGSWSYVGTDNLFIPKNETTMNFGWLDPATVLHEFGHMLGLGHEHQNPEGGIQWDKEAVVEELSGPPNYWSEFDVEWNIFRKYDEDQIRGTELDPESIMMYHIPNEWTVGNFETKWNTELSETDIEFISTVYPFDDSEEETDQEISWEELSTELFKRVFKSRREVARMREDTIVRLGMEMELDVDKKYRKRDNIDTVWNHLSQEL